VDRSRRGSDPIGVGAICSSSAANARANYPE